MVPPSQDAEQALHEPHARTMQSTGQACTLQLTMVVSAGQALPPMEPAVQIIVRVRFMKPAPHETEQASHAPHWPTRQSMAQLCALQLRVSAECGQALPPFMGSTVARLRFCAPVPHDLVQVDQAEKAGTTQSKMHTCALQLRVSV